MEQEGPVKSPEDKKMPAADLTAASKEIREYESKGDESFQITREIYNDMTDKQKTMMRRIWTKILDKHGIDSMNHPTWDNFLIWNENLDRKGATLRETGNVKGFSRKLEIEGGRKRRRKKKTRKKRGGNWQENLKKYKKYIVPGAIWKNLGSNNILHHEYNYKITDVNFNEDGELIEFNYTIPNEVIPGYSNATSPRQPDGYWIEGEELMEVWFTDWRPLFSSHGGKRRKKTRKMRGGFNWSSIGEFLDLIESNNGFIKIIIQNKDDRVSTEERLALAESRDDENVDKIDWGEYGYENIIPNKMYDAKIKKTYDEEEGELDDLDDEYREEVKDWVDILIYDDDGNKLVEMEEVMPHQLKHGPDMKRGRNWDDNSFFIERWFVLFKRNDDGTAGEQIKFVDSTEGGKRRKKKTRKYKGATLRETGNVKGFSRKLEIEGGRKRRRKKKTRKKKGGQKIEVGQIWERKEVKEDEALDYAIISDTQKIGAKNRIYFRFSNEPKKPENDIILKMWEDEFRKVYYKYETTPPYSGDEQGGGKRRKKKTRKMRGGLDSFPLGMLDELSQIRVENHPQREALIARLNNLWNGLGELEKSAIESMLQLSPGAYYGLINLLITELDMAVAVGGRRKKTRKYKGNKYPYKNITKKEAIADFIKLKTTTNPRSLNGLEIVNYGTEKLRVRTKYRGKSLIQRWKNKKTRKTLKKFANRLYKGPYTDDLLHAYRSAIALSWGTLSSMRTAAALQVYKKYNAKKVLDFTAGWGSRMTAALAADINYIGIDSNKSLKKGYKKIIKTVKKHTKSKVKLFFQPAETVDYSKLDYDFVFTSPPYEYLELYEHMKNYEGTKKIKQAHSANDRRRKNDGFYDTFLIPTIKEIYKHLPKGKWMCLNVPDLMYDKIKKKWKACNKKEDYMISKRVGSTMKSADRRGQEFVYCWKK